MITYLPLLVAALACVSALTAVAGVYRLLRPAGELEGRIGGNLSPQAAAALKALPKENFLKRLNRINLNEKLAGGIALQLTQADLTLTVNEYVLIRFGGSVACLLLGTVVLGSVLYGLVLAIVALQVPVFVLHFRCRKRQRRFQAQLVDSITMLASGLRAGVGLVQAMDLVRREMPEPSSTEFGRVVREVGLGVPLATSLQALLQRMPGDDLSMLATVINIQSEVGGNLASILDTVVETIRERLRIAQEIRTLTSMQRMTGYILAGLPFIVAILLFFLNPTYMGPLFTLQWIWLPGLALLMMAVGFFIISRITDIKV